MEKLSCAFCGGGARALDDELGPLIGPMRNDKSATGVIYVHRECALWSPKVRRSLSTASNTEYRLLHMQWKRSGSVQIPKVPDG
jgi:hypothetical protein